ncbi:putative Ig domain-containing protein [Pseudoalteromonas rubra]|uniref:Dystroglycan-type cadherin-like domain-containing protein n=1 Tax=Pseudoalteromonas rubra TaxID=43658 RepID=A0A0F4QDQ1_9GAMM|nr:Ig-like domain-containing protein [Pseudoalteromonas rubra]KJZ05843.1 hypothetical protein TW77_21395 [Pseudoalteromonas rubra]
MKSLNTASILLITLLGATGCGSSGDNHLSSGSANSGDKDQVVDSGNTGDKDSGDQGTTSKGDDVLNVKIIGAIEKGPFVVGSSVTINKLTELGQNTGTTIVTNTTNDLGHFDFNANATDLLQITSTGYYRNEITGELSSDTVTLRSLYKADENAQQQANVNLLTHLTSTRVLALLKSGEMSFEQAVVQAEEEFKRTFQQVIAAPEGKEFASVSIFDIQGSSDSAYLLTVSALAYQYALNKSSAKNTASEGELTFLINELEEDFGADGKIDDAQKLTELKAMHADIDPVAVTNNISQWIKGQSTLTVPDINRYLDSDLDGLVNITDTDDDNDGIPDDEDTNPFIAQLVSDDLSLSVAEDTVLAIEISSNSPLDREIVFEVQTQPQNGRLTGAFPQFSYQPNANFNGQDSFTFVLRQGELTSREVTASISVTPVNDAPAISGTASSQAVVGERYSFVPEASDIDLSALTFSVENLPVWASLNNQTGEISGTPTDAHGGMHSDIKVSVSDGELSATLPEFNIQVLYSALPGPEGLTSSAEEAEPGQHDVTLSWQNVEYAADYMLQIASDQNFTSPSYHDLTGSSEINLKLNSGTHFWRVSSVNPDGVEGTWSSVQQMELGVFTAIFGGSGEEWLWDAIATQDEGYLVLASTRSPELVEQVNADPHSWIFKVDAKGNLQWQYIRAWDSFNYLRKGIELSDGSFILMASGSNQLIKLDAQGSELWDKVYEQPAGTSKFTSILQVNGQLIAGRSTPEGEELVTISAESGEVTGSLSLPKPQTEVASTMYISTMGQTQAGNLWVAGGVNPEGLDGLGDQYRYAGAFLYIYDKDYEPVITWHNAGSGTLTANLHDIFELENGNFFFSGQSVSGYAWAMVSGDGTTIKDELLDSEFLQLYSMFERDGYFYGIEVQLEGEPVLFKSDINEWQRETVKTVLGTTMINNQDGTITLFDSFASGRQDDIVIKKTTLE